MNVKQNITDDLVMDRKLEKMVQKMNLYFSAQDQVRERLLKLSREVIRLSGSAIRSIHHGELKKSKDLISSAGKIVADMNQIMSDSRNYSGSGFVHDSFKEYAEACIVYSLIDKKPLPEPEQIAVGYPAYLNGLGEAVGELRRHLLDKLRKSNFSRADEILNLMDGILGVLVVMDYPDAITYGLRRTADVARGIVEKTRSDLTLVTQQDRLANKLAKFRHDIS